LLLYLVLRRYDDYLAFLVGLISLIIRLFSNGWLELVLLRCSEF